MPRKRKEPFLAVDIRIMEDREVQKLVQKKGRGAAFLWLEILMKFQQYEKTDFMVPMDDMDLFCNGFFLVSPEEVKSLIVYVAGFGWIKTFENSEGEKFFYNERRQMDLREQKLTRENRQRHIDEVNERRWGTGSEEEQ